MGNLDDKNVGDVYLWEKITIAIDSSQEANETLSIDSSIEPLVDIYYSAAVKLNNGVLELVEPVQITSEAAGSLYDSRVYYFTSNNTTVRYLASVYEGTSVCTYTYYPVSGSTIEYLTTLEEDAYSNMDDGYTYILKGKIEELIGTAVKKTGDLMTGELKVAYGEYPQVTMRPEAGGMAAVEGATTKASLQSYDVADDTDNRRSFQVHNATGKPDVAEALALTDYVNGGGQTYHIYGDHNPALAGGAAAMIGTKAVQVSGAGWRRVVTLTHEGAMLVQVGNNYRTGGQENILLYVTTHGNMPTITVLSHAARGTARYTAVRLVETDAGTAMDIYYNHNLSEYNLFRATALLHGYTNNNPKGQMQNFELQDNSDILGSAVKAEIPTTNLPSGNILTDQSGARIESGSYTGTDGYGEDNAITLTFGFEPKMVIVQSGSGYSLDFLPLIKEVSMTGDNTNSGSSTAAVYVTWGANSVSWYSAYNEESMKNVANTTYYYIAIS